MIFSPIETARLRLRPIAVDDWPQIHRYLSDPEVTRWLPEGVLDEAGSRAFAARHASDEGEALAVLRKDSGELIGHMMYHPWFGARTHEVGWIFARPHQGHGYATEAAEALLAHAFETLRRHRVVATCQPQNPASWRVMEKLGMRREAHFRSALQRPSGEWWDEYFYAILDDEYFARAGRSPTA